MTDYVRILRILEYTGPREWVEQTLEHGGVPANGNYYPAGPKAGKRITSRTLGDFPEVLEEEEDYSGDDNLVPMEPGDYIVTQDEVRDGYYHFAAKPV